MWSWTAVVLTTTQGGSKESQFGHKDIFVWKMHHSVAMSAFCTKLRAVSRWTHRSIQTRHFLCLVSAVFRSMLVWLIHQFCKLLCFIFQDLCSASIQLGSIERYDVCELAEVSPEVIVRVPSRGILDSPSTQSLVAKELTKRLHHHFIIAQLDHHYI